MLNFIFRFASKFFFTDPRKLHVYLYLSLASCCANDFDDRTELRDSKMPQTDSETGILCSRE